jgi:hypothetical protein
MPHLIPNFWHAQGSARAQSTADLAEKVAPPGRAIQR